MNILCSSCLFVCFKGVMGTSACPGSPFCLTDMSVFAEIPKVVNSLCFVENSVLGTRESASSYFTFLVNNMLIRPAKPRSLVMFHEIYFCISFYVQSFLYNVLSLTLILGLGYKQREETASRNNFSKQTLNSLAI